MKSPEKNVEILQEIIVLYFESEGNTILCRLLTLDFMFIWLNILISSIVALILLYIYPGIEIGWYFTAIVVAILLAWMNSIIGPIQKMLTPNPDVLNLFFISIAVNVATVLFLARFIPWFNVDGNTVAFIFASILSLIGAGLSLDRTKKIHR